MATDEESEVPDEPERRPLTEMSEAEFAAHIGDVDFSHLTKGFNEPFRRMRELVESFNVPQDYEWKLSLPDSIVDREPELVVPDMGDYHRELAVAQERRDELQVAQAEALEVVRDVLVKSTREQMGSSRQSHRIAKWTLVVALGTLLVAMVGAVAAVLALT